MRTCVGCRRAAPVEQLVRVTRDETGALILGRKQPGRGAWLCVGQEAEWPAEGCVEQSIRRQAFARAFRAPVPAAAVAVLREMVRERARIERGDAVGVARRRD